MAKIAYADKVKGGTFPTNKFRDSDANEIKTSVNALYDAETLNDGKFDELYIYLNTGLFAALEAAETTPVTVAAEYTPILGAFSNSPAVGFIGVDDPAIKYTGTQTMYFEISAHATIKTNRINATVSFGIKKNGVLVSESVMSLFAKTATEAYTFGGVCVVSLATNNTIQMVVTSDIIADVQFTNLTATIRPFILQ